MLQDTSDLFAVRPTLPGAIEEYLRRKATNKALKTRHAYSYNLAQFQAFCPRKYLDQITRTDLTDFVAHLRSRGLAERTVHNMLESVNAFLRDNDITGLLKQVNWPTYEEKVVEAYSEEQLQRLFAAATPEESLVFRFFLASGCREAEVAHATWKDLNFTDRTFTVHFKEGFRPKDKSERCIPLPDTLVAELKQKRFSQVGSLYIFPTREGKVNGHFLRMLKALAFRAGLNCRDVH